MIELLQKFEKINLEFPALITWGTAAILLLIALVSQRASIKENLTEWKLNRLLKNLGRESLHNVTIPDGMDGKIFIEYLILTPHEILLLGVKQYRGLIFAADTIDLWTQVIGKKSYKFENPLHQLESDVSALSAYVDKAKINSKVLFVKGSEFPKGKPTNIVSIQDVKDLQREYAVEEIPDHLRTDWKRLVDLASKNNLSKGDNVLLDNQTGAGINMVSLISFTGLISFWLVWRFMY